MTKTPTLRRFLPLLIALVVASFSATPADAQRKTHASSSRTEKKSRSDKADKKADKSKSAKSEKSNAKSAAKEKAATKRGRDRADDRAGRNDKSARGRRDKAERDDAKSAKDRRNMSRRERAQEAARLRAERIEAERRRQEEIARRIEAARQARLAAIARERAANQALRDETAANIAKDDTIGEDLEVRKAAVDALGTQAGTVVVMDPKNGRVFTVVNQDWALRRGFKPCSTIKLVTGLAGLTDGVIQPVETVTASTGRYSLNLNDSLAYSNNAYFQTVGGRVGFDDMVKMGRELGLGERTGINHPNESAGRVPLFKQGYAVNHMSSHGDDFGVTPIQLATLVSAIGNGGKLLVPHLPRTPEENIKFKSEVRRQVKVAPEYLRRMVPGMIGAVNYGTAKLAYDSTQTVCGKTGTCIDDGSWVGLFASYAPVEDPRLAVVVIVKGSGARGKVAAGVAGRIYRNLNTRFNRGSGVTPPQLAAAPGSLAPHRRVDAVAARAISDEDVEADAVGGAANATAVGIGATDAQRGTASSEVRRVLQPVTRPVETTTRPATPAPSTTAPARTVIAPVMNAPARQAPMANQPAQVQPGTTPSTPAPSKNERPRRVLSTSPW